MKNVLENLTKISISNTESKERPRFLKILPLSPGVYVYFKNKKVIYVGKAVSLKKRVASYFNLDLDQKTARMISEANFISYIKVSSELEALLLEARLIRQYMPHYNIAAKDDKHPLYILITKEEFPRVITVRKVDLAQKLSLAVYGPFPSSTSVKSVLKLVRRIIPFSDHKIGNRPCLYSHIGLCSPCPSVVINIKDANLKINESKKYKSNILKIKSILDGKIEILTKKLRQEMSEKSKTQNYEEALRVRTQIEQIEYITRPQMPTDFYLKNPNLYEDQRDKELLSLRTILKEAAITFTSLNHIECFDIAHLAGSNATASMVTFIDAEAEKSRYRHFKIKKAKGGDDYESMREVARRRAGHFIDWGKPDLIIVDGGIGQVKAFKDLISEVPIVGVAKHPDRLIVPLINIDSFEKIKLAGHALNLVSRMRDEAHRFARRYHHKLVSSSILKPNL